MTMNLIDCSYAQHAAQILDIFNEAIANSTALYDYQPRTLETMQRWFESKAAGKFPVLGALDGSGQFLGFASYGTFRAFPAYKYTAEHSVYVHVDRRGHGIGRALLQQLIARAREQQYHVLVGAIDVGNSASIALHEALGFLPAGTIRQAGFKLKALARSTGYQLVLETPLSPVDG